MSKNEKTVEDRVVSMQFDNSKFEKNVDQSIKTLDRLKKSLNMDSAAKGFNELNKASNSSWIFSYSFFVTSYTSLTAEPGKIS